MKQPIITSLLDTDLYKLTMMQCVLHQVPSAEVTYEFKCRNKAILSPYADQVSEQISHLCALRFKDDELEYLSTLDYIKSDFIEFLRLFHLNERFIEVSTDGDDLNIIIKGPWLHTILFEVPILAIVNQIYFENIIEKPDHDEGRRRLQNKIALIKQEKDIKRFIFSDFGTRRRFSKKWQFEVDQTLTQAIPEHFRGTSNVANAKKLSIRPIGTMAHEFLQACQAIGPRLVDSEKYALELWAKEYRGRLGIALTDVVGINAFLNDFDLYFAKLFDGLRQDSGDPIEWGNKVLAHYRKHKIDPRTKTLVFSDNLTVPKAIEIYHYFKNDAEPVFGIGTNLTNDLGYDPINIVIKMTRCNEQSVAKISDTPGKSMCKDPSYVNYLRKVFKVDG
ncbi:MAG: nicotinate phosphoribosyltransferase [Gammaproteobacteria bacterium]|nr:nicotinate phosphoribosyltransferase [Gammaproteobacteria bacterium]MCH9743422.1 nicotinate phosphoribosyltransferase [Gammaproteobacteria bacterium]